MIIGIDGNEANTSKLVGIGEYAFELLLQFSKFQISPQGHYLPRRVANFKFQIYLKNKPRNDLPQETEHWKYVVFGPRKLWTQIALPFHLYTHAPKPDVFFSPTHYAPRFSPVPRVISIMDLSFLHFPELFRPQDLYQLKNWTAYSAKKAEKILTISEASKNDIIEQYHVSEENVVVIYPGVKPVRDIAAQVYTMNTLSREYNIAKPYLLFVGTLQPRKNIKRLIEAFSRLLKKKDVPDSLQLVIVGKRGWLFEEILRAPELYGVTKNVSFLDYVPDGKLPMLYENALGYVLPSLYEGFGLPVLEAMKYGCPVITSNVSSLPEAAGDAALFVDPENVDDITAQMEKLVRSEDLRKTLIEKGYKQVKKFSWEKAAAEALHVLEAVGGKK